MFPLASVATPVDPVGGEFRSEVSISVLGKNLAVRADCQDQPTGSPKPDVDVPSRIGGNPSQSGWRGIQGAEKRSDDPRAAADFPNPAITFIYDIEVALRIDRKST